MAAIDVDVVSEGPVTDVPLLRARELIQDRINASSVYNMVKQIKTKIKENKIRRLRIFGHGSPGVICIGNMPRQAPLDEADRERILEENSLKVIRVITHGKGEVDEKTGKILPQHCHLWNETVLGELKDRFVRKGNAWGWVELHSCNVAEGPQGELLLKTLAQILWVDVQGGTGKQIAGGGLENTVVQAKSSGQISRRESAHALPAGKR